MVVFACNGCGSSLKKNQVEKHKFQCRKCEAVSCMDCGKDFWGDEFKAHIKCVTEDEKYGGANYVPKPGSNKNEKKQEAWVEHVNAVIAEKGKGMDPKLRQLLEAVCQFPNVPRKKPKFVNFVQNSLYCRNPVLIEKAWDVFAAGKPQPATPGGQQPQTQRDGNKEEREEKGDADPQPPTANSDKQEGDEETKKLSKREKKELRRQQHDKAEKKDKKNLKRRVDDDEDDADDDGEEPADCGDDASGEAESKKKKKKRKQTESEEGADDEGVAPKKKSKKSKPEVANGHAESGTETVGKKKKKKKKNKKQQLAEEEEDEGVEMAGDAEEAEEVATPKPKAFKWETVMTEILASSVGNELPVKKLRKKVLAEYESRGGEGKGDKSYEWAASKFDKKLKNSSLFKVLKDRVKLVSTS